MRQSPRLEATPQGSAVTLTSTPLCVEPRQMGLKRTLANPEDVGSLTAQHPANEAAAMSREAYDLLDGNAGTSLPEDR